MENKLNLEGIHMDMDELLEKYNHKIHSCDDGMEIQQISLFCQNNRNDYRKPVLMDMINPQFAYAALYPHIQQFHYERPDIQAAVWNLDNLYENGKIPKYRDITILDHADLISDKPISDETRKLIEKMEGNSDYKAYAQNLIHIWSNPEEADEVTKVGREKLREVMKLMNELGYTPLVGDKDEIKFGKINKL